MKFGFQVYNLMKDDLYHDDSRVDITAEISDKSNGKAHNAR